MNTIPWWHDTRLLVAGDALSLQGHGVGISTVPDPSTQDLIDAFRECHWTVHALVYTAAYLCSPEGHMAMIQVTEEDPEKVVRVEIDGQGVPVAAAAATIRSRWRWQK